MNKRLNTVICTVLTILLTLVLAALYITLYADRCISTEDFMKQQVQATDTYNNAYDSLMKKFSDSCGETSIPVEVDEKAFSRDWMKSHIDKRISVGFADFDGEGEMEYDFTAVEKSLTEYFEEYARTNHVIKDETYEKRLAESIANAEKTAVSAVDVYHLETMKSSGIWSDIGTARNIIPRLKTALIAAAAVIAVLILLLKNFFYWIGTALFASGCILSVPTAIVKFSGYIMRFAVKDHTAYNLVTKTLTAVNGNVLISGLGMAAVGIIMIIIGIIIRRHKEKGETEQ
ncbi:MAG: hypothetical protein IJ779_01950 [Ruminococcus sp.]|nr:hypothetical protein [Ruminococcus sp.]